ncbi:cyclic AMP-responsive element-binding protein 1, partial [Trichonephila clavata]
MVTVSAADLQAYQIRASTPTGGLSQGSLQTIQNPQQLAEEAARKRELRLLKNREAAKECRRKKKSTLSVWKIELQCLRTRTRLSLRSSSPSKSSIAKRTNESLENSSSFFLSL